MREISRHRDHDLDQAELEILLHLGFITPVASPVADWISILIGGAQSLLKDPHGLSLRSIIEERSWRLAQVVCYLPSVLMKTPPNVVASVIIVIAVEVESGSVVLQSFQKRVLQISKVSFELCEKVKKLITNLAKEI